MWWNDCKRNFERYQHLLSWLSNAGGDPRTQPLQVEQRAGDICFVPAEFNDSTIRDSSFLMLRDSLTEWCHGILNVSTHTTLFHKISCSKVLFQTFSRTPPPPPPTPLRTGNLLRSQKYQSLDPIFFLAPFGRSCSIFLSFFALYNGHFLVN